MTDGTEPSVTERLLALLRASGLPFTPVDHSVSHTATAAAQARGTPLEIGGKSLVMKMGPEQFGVFVVSGAGRLDSWKIRHMLGIRRYRFATPDELLSLTGLRPGCVPPFGRPLFDLPLYVDTVTAELPHIAFSLAHHERSALMRTADWLAVARPERVVSLS